MFQFDQVVIDMIWKGIRETLFMTLMSTLMGYVLGLPLGIALAVTDKGGIHPNRVVYRILDVITNVIRSIPFLILLILVNLAQAKADQQNQQVLGGISEK